MRLRLRTLGNLGRRDMWQVAFEVRFVFLAILRMMQESVGIVEDVPFCDGVVVVMGTEVCQCPIGDVFTAVCAVLVVGVEGKTLGWRSKTACHYED